MISVILYYRYHKKKGNDSLKGIFSDYMLCDMYTSDNLMRSRSSVTLRRNDAYECRANFRVKMKSNPAYELHDISAN